MIPLGHFEYPCEGDLVCKVQIDDVPYFNAPIYLENKEQIGKIDEIFGTLRDYFVTIKLSENMKANSFTQLQKVYISLLLSVTENVRLFLNFPIFFVFFSAVYRSWQTSTVE